MRFLGVSLKQKTAYEMLRSLVGAEDGIRDAQESRGLGDVYKRQDRGPFYYSDWGRLCHSRRTLCGHERPSYRVQFRALQRGTRLRGAQGDGYWHGERQRERGRVSNG